MIDIKKVPDSWDFKLLPEPDADGVWTIEVKIPPLHGYRRGESVELHPGCTVHHHLPSHIVSDLVTRYLERIP